ncbi:hypothetical protein ARMGADRAFT_732038 [Armillaria gallica]|uniref:Uncharacterized protein n=1 Tax=Armillaria gallica TaxID=47427 RepID=A0A2H3D0H5_ARMGA|nr:hypothetical protein ARMGADRAFT_732038 [Armillaria gallica]
MDRETGEENSGFPDVLVYNSSTKKVSSAFDAWIPWVVASTLSSVASSAYHVLFPY